MKVAELQQNILQTNLDQQPKIEMKNLKNSIFVNKPLDLNKIKMVGYSIDHAIVTYTPAFYDLVYKMLVEKLIVLHYPQSIQSLKYVHCAHSSVTAVDMQAGNALKVDEFGNIHVCVHGLQTLQKSVYGKLYPAHSVKLDQPHRFFVNRSSFDQILIQLYCQLVDKFEKEFQKIKDPIALSSEQKLPELAVTEGKICYQNLFNDICKIFQDMITNRKEILKQCLLYPDNYWHIQQHLRESILRLRASNKKTFILSNLDVDYTFAVLKYAFSDKFMDLFDYVIISKSHSSFFCDKKPFRRYYPEQRQIGLGGVGETLENGVYYGGNVGDFDELSGVRVKYTLYFCDKFLQNLDVYKAGLWHFCQMVPSLEREFQVLEEQHELVQAIQKQQFKQRQLLARLDSSEIDPPEALLESQQKLEQQSTELQYRFGQFGSTFFTTWSLTHYGSQLRQFCDIYCQNGACMYYYAPFVVFTMCFQNRFLPHQSIDLRAGLNEDGEEVDVEEGI